MLFWCQWCCGVNGGACAEVACKVVVAVVSMVLLQECCGGNGGA